MDRDDARGGETMKQPVSPSAFSTSSWSWPLAIERYDCSPDLRREEYEALAHLFEQSHGQIRQPTMRLLQRLVGPLEDVLRLTRAPRDAFSATIRIVCIEMYQRQTTFWTWSVDEWFALLGPNITVV